VPSCHLEPTEIFAVCNGATGSHTDYGVIIAAGPGIAEGVEVKGARLMDVAPTALYAMGVPLNEDMDGRPVADLFTLEFAAEHSVTSVGTGGLDRPRGPVPAPRRKMTSWTSSGLGYIS
jgi:arylsulfatase A-like enzyme